MDSRLSIVFYEILLFKYIVIFRESEWSPEANDKFAELAYLAKWKVLVAKVRGYKERSVDYAGSRRKGSMIPCIDLYERVGDKVR